MATTFWQAQIAFLLAQQEPTGGFRGKAGAADLYYTRFALRALSILRSASQRGDLIAAAAAAARFLQQAQPTNLVDLFCLLDSWQAVRGLMSLAQPEEEEASPAEAATWDMAARLLHQSRAGKGIYARHGVPSLYATFLAWECSARLQISLPADDLPSFLRLCRRRDGGFADTPHGSSGQMAATAAAVLLGLRLWGTDLAPHSLYAACADFALSLKESGGGFRPHREAAMPDLLSTRAAAEIFHGLKSDAALPLAATLKFIHAVGHARGGFGGWPGDEPDAEHTCYALELLERFLLPRCSRPGSDELPSPLEALY
ncbi:MAG: hypothetical protein N3A66_02905 [Planctomycetota bacterium]|nr:hypothetical protein [Planctomycetota bacterium]